MSSAMTIIHLVLWNEDIFSFYIHYKHEHNSSNQILSYFAETMNSNKQSLFCFVLCVSSS